jgi:hypothetical protein
MVNMGTPDTSDIDLNPANFRCRADLVYCLNQLYTKIGCPSYRRFHDEILESMSIDLPIATISDLIGKKSKTSTSRPELRTVELFVLGCGVPETELEGWRKAWEASVAEDRPDWQEERQQLLVKIDQLTADLATAEARAGQLTEDLTAEKVRTDHFTTVSAAAKRRTDQLTTSLTRATAHTDQLTTDLAEAKTRRNDLARDLVIEKKRTDQLTITLAAKETLIHQLTTAVEAAETRATDAEATLTAYHQSQSRALCLPEPLERLRIRAETSYDARDYVEAVKLYSQIATQVEREHGPGNQHTLQARCRHLEVKTEAFVYACSPYRSKRIRFRGFKRRKLNTCWRYLIFKHQRYLPEGNRTTLELRLEYIYWVAKLFNPAGFSSDLSPARKLLIALHTDCKLFLSPGDPLAAQVVEYMKAVSDSGFARPTRQRSLEKSELRRPTRRRASEVFQYGGADRDN